MVNVLPATLFLILGFYSTTLHALNIALTNDDGWDAPGIQTLRSALMRAGHRVTLVGSSENQSGSSAALDLGQGNLLVTKQFEDGEALPGGDQYSVSLAGGAGAEPATAGQLAIAIAGQAGDAVDLLVSGVNAGANIGPFTNVSGTIGAVLHGISWVSGSRVPAIAISTDEPSPLRACATGNEAHCKAANLAHFEVVADWMTGLVSELEKKPGRLKRSVGLLPEGIALNINYPANDSIKGVRLNVQGIVPSLHGQAIGLPIGCYGNCVAAAVGAPVPAGVVQPEPVQGQQERRNADTTAFNDGYVSIVVIDTDLTAGKQYRRAFGKLVSTLHREAAQP